jgi:hypothetical protein
VITVARSGLGRERYNIATECEDHSHPSAHEIGSQFRQPIVIVVRKAEAQFA